MPGQTEEKTAHVSDSPGMTKAAQRLIESAERKFGSSASPQPSFMDEASQLGELSETVSSCGKHARSTSAGGFGRRKAERGLYSLRSSIEVRLWGVEASIRTMAVPFQDVVGDIQFVALVRHRHGTFPG